MADKLRIDAGYEITSMSASNADLAAILRIIGYHGLTTDFNKLGTQAILREAACRLERIANSGGDYSR